jgi:hypothetical protein
MRIMFKRLITGIIICAAAAAAFTYTQDSLADEFFDFPENYEVRQQVKEDLLAPLFDDGEDTRYFPVWGKSYRVKYEKIIRGEDLFYSFITGTGGGFPRDARGSYIIKRSRRNGLFQWMKIVLRAESHSYLKITPDGGRCLAELVLLNEPLYRNLVLPIDFSALMFEPFSKVVQLTENSVDWKLILYRARPADYGGISGVLERIEALRPLIKEADDGAQNRAGEFVYIESGEPQNHTGGFNCSGFAKWVVDGFYKPLAGFNIDIGLLKQKHEDLRGNRWNKEYYKYRDLYFGLDWTRNLASVLEEERTQSPQAFESADVRSVKYFTYREDSGYPVKNLMLLMYILAANEPGYFYIGSVNNIYPKNPLLHSHFHVALFFPYFDPNGNFRLAVLDQHAQRTAAAFISQYSGDYIHLVRIKASGVFSPAIP